MMVGRLTTAHLTTRFTLGLYKRYLVTSTDFVDFIPAITSVLHYTTRSIGSYPCGIMGVVRPPPFQFSGESLRLGNERVATTRY